jgi:hypothetical protein
MLVPARHRGITTGFDTVPPTSTAKRSGPAARDAHVARRATRLWERSPPSRMVPGIRLEASPVTCRRFTLSWPLPRSRFPSILREDQFLQAEQGRLEGNQPVGQREVHPANPSGQRSGSPSKCSRPSARRVPSVPASRQARGTRRRRSRRTAGPPARARPPRSGSGRRCPRRSGLPWLRPRRERPGVPSSAGASPGGP